MTNEVTRRQPAPPGQEGGQRQALEREALALAPSMFRLACRLMGSVPDAEDALQEAFAKAVTELRRGAFRGDCALSTWLYRVVTTVALDHLRRERRHAQGAPDEAPQGQASTPNAEAAVALRELSEAMEALPPDQRAALVLKELHGLPTREVAQVLERTEGATEQLLVRARQTLRGRFES